MSLIGSCVIAPNCVSAADNVVSLPLVLASTPTIMADTVGAAPTLTLSGVYGTVSLSKLGAGVVSLTGANTYGPNYGVWGHADRRERRGAWQRSRRHQSVSRRHARPERRRPNLG